VAEAVHHYYNIYGGEVRNKRVIVQGWGNVGSAAAYYLAQQGARIVGIIDRAGGLLAPEGLSFEQVRELFHNKQGNQLAAEGLLSFDDAQARIWDMEADIFLPCAASRLVTREQLDRLIDKGLEVVSCGANVPFNDPEIFYGPVYEYVDSRVSVLPDFIANCGMARVFAFLMNNNVEISDQAIFSDVTATIRNALALTHGQSRQRTAIASTAFEIALKQLL
jgi:glutamate dehydrogenase (NAD(P)+)